MYIYFDGYSPYSDKYQKICKNVNADIQCEHGYAYSSSKQRMCTWVNEEIWEMMKICFLMQSK